MEDERQDMNDRVIRIAIAGFGTIGRATAALMLSRRAHYHQRYGIDLRLVAICGSRAGFSADDGIEACRFDALEMGKSGPTFIAASRPDVMIEAGPTDPRTGMPGIEYIRAALSSACDTIVVSKGALVLAGRELRACAEASGAMLKVSGAAGAALPTVDLLRYSLAGSAVLRLEGILNATTNFLLDTMMERGIGLAAALEEAQAGGFVEQDPQNDIRGWDTASKLLIMANFGLEADLSLNDIRVAGIQAINEQQISDYRTLGQVPKLVGSLRRDSTGFYADVRVRGYPESDQFARVSGTDKAIRVFAEEMGEIVVTVSGLEPAATAAAVLKDLEHILESRFGAEIAGKTM